MSQVRAAVPVDAATDSGLDRLYAFHRLMFLICGAEIALSFGWGDVLVVSILL